MTAPQKGAARALCTADFDARGAATVANQGKHQVGCGWGASWSQWCIKIGIWDENGWEMDGRWDLTVIFPGRLFHSF